MNSTPPAGDSLNCAKVVIAFTLGEKEFVQTSVRFARRSPWLFAIRILLIAIVAGAGVLLIAAGNVLAGMGILVLAFLLAILNPIAARRAAARTFRASKFMHCKITAEIDDEGTRFTYSSGTSDTKWNGYTDWSETDDMLVLFLSDQFVRIFPKRAFSESELTSTRALLERRLPKR